MEKIKISIIIPVYNVEKYLERCLNSVEKQTFKNFEAIIVNDGSTDKSSTIAQKYVSTDKRFKLIEQDNKGLGGARNTGIQCSNGEFLAFLDSDDWYHERFLELMLDAADSNDADIVICGVERVWNDGSRKKNPISNADDYVVQDKHGFMKKASYVAWDKIYRANLFDSILYPEHMKYEDYATTPRIYAKASKIVCISDILYNYYWNANSITNSSMVSRDLFKAQRLLEESEIGEKYFDVMEAYFVRNIMGTLLWKMCNEGPKVIPEIRDIVRYGLEKYPNINKIDLGIFMGKHKNLWGKLILSEHYELAELIVFFDETIKAFGRKIKYQF